MGEPIFLLIEKRLFFLAFSAFSEAFGCWQSPKAVTGRIVCWQLIRRPLQFGTRTAQQGYLVPYVGKYIYMAQSGDVYLHKASRCSATA